MSARSVFFLTFALNSSFALAGLPGQDRNVDALRVLMQNARVPTQADLLRLDSARLSCKGVEAIVDDSNFGESLAPQFAVRGNVIMDVNPNVMHPYKVYVITNYGLSWTMREGAFTWRHIYRMTTDGRLVSELSLSPQGGYQQGRSVVNPQWFAKSYEVCALD